MSILLPGYQVVQQLLVLVLVCVVAAATVQAQSVRPEALEQRDGRYYLKDSDTPYTGKVEDPGRMVGQLEDGLRVGTWEGWHANGQRSFVFEHENGALRHRIIWHPNGVKRMEGSYVDGLPDGLHRQWDDNGQQVTEMTYRAGKLEGVRRLWGPDGALLQTATYKDGQLDGPSIWYYADGAKRWETHFEAGERAGVWTQWMANGEVMMQSEWNAGTLVKRTNPHRGH